MAELDRLPMIAGFHQFSLPGAKYGPQFLTPFQMAQMATFGALEDAGVPGDQIVNIGWVGFTSMRPYDPGTVARRFADTLNLPGTVHCEDTEVGGNAPLQLVNNAARAIMAGADMALVVNVSNDLGKSLLRLSDPTAWPSTWPKAPAPKVDPAKFFEPHELAAGLNLVHLIAAFALENVRIAHELGQTLLERRRADAEILDELSLIACRNKLALDPKVRSVDDIVRSRDIATSIPLLACPSLNVAMGSAVLMMSAEKAKALGVPPAKLVAWRGGARASADVRAITRRPTPLFADGLKRAMDATLKMAGVRESEVLQAALYVCFPQMLTKAWRTLPWLPRAAERISFIGGLPSFGQPNSGPALHDFCGAVDRCRTTDDGDVIPVCAQGGIDMDYEVTAVSRVLPAALPDLTLAEEDPDRPRTQPMPLGFTPVDGQGTIYSAAVSRVSRKSSVAFIIVEVGDEPRPRIVAQTPVNDDIFAAIDQGAVGKRCRLWVEGDRQLAEPL